MVDNFSMEDLPFFAMLFSAFMLAATFGGLVFGLFVYHVYLISIGSTTWEMWKRHRIDYLKPYPIHFMPFSEGFIRNWYSAICHGSVLKNWTLPRPLAVYPFNW
jgi:hypothetical protein